MLYFYFHHILEVYLRKIYMLCYGYGRMRLIPFGVSDMGIRTQYTVCNFELSKFIYLTM